MPPKNYVRLFANFRNRSTEGRLFCVTFHLHGHHSPVASGRFIGHDERKQDCVGISSSWHRKKILNFRNVLLAEDVLGIIQSFVKWQQQKNSF